MSDTGILDGIPPEFSSDFYKSDFDQDFIDNIRATIERDPNRALDPMDTGGCLLYTSPSPRDGLLSRMPSSA